MVWRILGIFTLLVALAAAGAYAWLGRDARIAGVTPPDPASFPADTVDRGAVLASAGGCEVCHTREGDPPFAGGRAIETPFGTIHATNITPDRETGIGTWSRDAFVRAMREGVAGNGRHLYPAFPYTHFTRITDDDLDALYAFVMTRDPVSATAPANALSFPANFRPFLGIWKLLYLDAGVLQPNPDRSDSWNRGAYLVRGLGHCSACHGARNALGGIVPDQAFAGGTAEGWHAFALDGSSPAPVPWSDIALVNYMLDGWDLDHGVAAGPMLDVVDHFRALSEDDAFAVAEYMLSLQPEPADGARDAAITFAEGRQIGGGGDEIAAGFDGTRADGAATFERICANCHRASSDTVPLGLTSSVNGPDPRNVIEIILDGIDPPAGSPNKSMRGFSATLNDAELAALVAFLRAQFTGHEAWTGVDGAIAAARGG